MIEKEPNIESTPLIFEGKIEGAEDMTLDEARQVFEFGPDDHLLVETIRERYYELSLKWVSGNENGRKNLATLNKAMDILKKEFMKSERK